ncbi:hypothetical protein L905_08275 [Agrobacterium sp. TS43]|nr:hypothetical protein L905_08275 [Agrobacterium sp. TS43]
MFDRLSFDADTAAILLMKPGYRAQEGRLAAPLGPRSVKNDPEGMEILMSERATTSR